MNPIEPIRPVPVTRVERATKRRQDDDRPPRDRPKRDDKHEPEDETGLDVRV